MRALICSNVPGAAMAFGLSLAGFTLRLRRGRISLIERFEA
jgi:hypothetical protein